MMPVPGTTQNAQSAANSAFWASPFPKHDAEGLSPDTYIAMTLVRKPPCLRLVALDIFSDHV